MFRIMFIMLVSLSLTAAATLSGCNTLSGAGQDIEQGGRAISDEANKHID